ncbi:MAG TPA: glycosyltransferase family 4 protein [Polyangiaceae bacterium]|nr:glycosyltransferase family 4 protein [Polyangiaceae bacterium]
MKVALFHPAFEMVGGAEILVATQASVLRRANVDACIATFSVDQRRWRERLEGIPVRLAPRASWLDRISGPLTRLRRAVPRAEACLAGVDTVLAWNYPANILLGACSITARRIWCCTEPSRDYHLPATNPHLHQRVTSRSGGITAAELEYPGRLRRYERAIRKPSWAAYIAFDVDNTRKLDAIYAISEFSRDNVRRVYGRDDAEIICPVVRFPPPLQHRSGLDRRGLQVLTHSRLETTKNVDTVIRGFARLAAQRPGSQLHVVGEGTQRANLEKLSHELEIAASVRFHGYLPEKELDAVYGACDVFALLTLDEPFGMVFPEAAARGLLMVGPDHGGPFEIMDGGRLGWPCDPFSPEAFVDVLLEIDGLTDVDVDQRRAKADHACRDRYGEAVIGARLLRAIDPRRYSSAVGA